MCSSSREEIAEVLGALDADFDQLLELSFDALTTPERMRILKRIETFARRVPVAGHELINQLSAQATREELGGKLAQVLADELRISRAEAARRVAEAADLGPRTALTGEVLPPVLTATAAAQRAGGVGAGHVRVIRGFVHRLPGFVDVKTREHAEGLLADKAAQFRPEQVASLAETLTDCLNPDGDYTEADRARARGLTLGNQDADGMSPIRGWLTPQARATLDAVLAKCAAPGMCNPDDEQPVVDGEPPAEAAQRDHRSAAQRNHDALNAALRGVLASGDLGQHGGLPATIVVTTTLAELESAEGKARTGGGSTLPMSDVIRLARHAHHYLAIFDKGKAVGLYHGKRLASPGQRIVLYAKDRGCTRPGCDAPPYWCEVHHVEPWSATHTTDINQLTLACPSDHKLLDQGWTTRKNASGDTEWIPPPHLDTGQPRTNTFHHPEKLLQQEDETDVP
jgi:hypothetical protein